MTATHPAPWHALVRAEELLARPEENRLYIDVRLGDPEIEFKSYREAHVHGAVHAQIRDVFAAAPTASSGNLPLPDPETLLRTLSAWRVAADTEVIVYGPSPALAARAWWVLRWAGLAKVRLLDGGMKAWIAAGGPLAQGDAPACPVPAEYAARRPLALSAGCLKQASIDEVAASHPAMPCIDARDRVSYAAGHIPGALNLPAADLWTPSGRLRSPAALVRILEEAGVPAGAQAVVYCGAGVLSALTFFAFAELGLHPRLYVGSWSEWARDPERRSRAGTGDGR